ncbi:hypothetical protein C8Q79DRAFT_950501 [Trametes meyenii]|nr:hypothetical protein C8Q79DRAFT_950501 [Trametes meyenii]
MFHSSWGSPNISRCAQAAVSCQAWACWRAWYTPIILRRMFCRGASHARSDV